MRISISGVVFWYRKWSFENPKSLPHKVLLQVLLIPTTQSPKPAALKHAACAAAVYSELNLNSLLMDVHGFLDNSAKARSP